jgi:hypothetical protein
MTTMQVVLIIVIAIVVIAALAAGYMLIRRRNLQQRFGPEYDRMVSQTGSRSAAEKELLARQRRHAELDLRPLSAESRRRYLRQWEEIQARFLDAPDQATRAGDELLTRLVAERGYPTDDFDEQVAELSVEHAHTLGRYREAHDIVQRHERGEASTEQLRQALVHYRELFAELVGERPAASDGSADGSVLASNGSAPAGDARVRGTTGHEQHRHEENGHREHRDEQHTHEEYEEEDRDALRR